MEIFPVQKDRKPKTENFQSGVFLDLAWPLLYTLERVTVLPDSFIHVHFTE